VVVAVIDTGYTDHSDLLANILPGYDFISEASRSNDGDGRDSDAHDAGDYEPGANSSWHGTHVSGTVAAIGNNAKGVIGVAYGAKVLPVRVLGAGGGDGTDIADAITWASGGTVPGAPANPNPAEVLNLSIGGGGGCSATYQAAIDGATSRGSLVVVSAGNSNIDANTGSLATCNNVVVVGAHTSTAARSSFSNYGASVDVTAPGSSILSTLNTGTTTPVAESYVNYQGTSMAAPHVAGAASAGAGAPRRGGAAPVHARPARGAAEGDRVSAEAGLRRLLGRGRGRRAHDAGPGRQRTVLLTDGVAQASQAATTGNGLRFAMVSSSKAVGLTFASSGGTGNADMYVKFGSPPTTGSFDCSSTLAGNGESCVIASAQPGTYYVLLQASSGYSGVSVTGATSGNRKPVPAFSWTDNGLTANFSDASADADGGVTSRSWSFGDGLSSTQANPVHAYSKAGAYTVQLTANDGAAPATARCARSTSTRCRWR
jgi:serine protease